MSVSVKERALAQAFVGTTDSDSPKLFVPESPREQKCHLLILMDTRIKRLFEKDLYYACKYVLGYHLLKSNPHGEVCEWLQTNQHEDTMLLVPRGTYKSTISTVAYPIWKLQREPDHRFLLTSAEHENTKKWLAEIRIQLERNPDFRRLFGNWVPKRSKERAEQWTSSHIRIPQSKRLTGQASILATSYKISKVSHHVDEVVADDLMNEKTVTSREAILKTEEHIQMLTPILDPIPQRNDKPGPIHEVGTRWGHDDLYGRQLARDKANKAQGLPRKWKTFIRKYIDSRGRLFCPDPFTKEFLDNLYSSGTMTRFQISCQYLNDPQPEEDRIFKLEHFGFWNANGRTLTKTEMALYGKGKDGKKKLSAPEIEKCKRLGACDPASEENDDSDWTAIVGVAVDYDRKKYVLEVRRGRWNRPAVTVEHILEMQIRHRMKYWGIESVAFQGMIKAALADAFIRNGIRVPVEGLKHRNIDKKVRIRGLEPFVSDGGWFFRLPDDIDVSDHLVPDPRWGWNYDREALLNLLEDHSADQSTSSVSAMGVLADELLKFPTSSTWDCADASAYLVPKFRSRVKSEESTDNERGSPRWWRELARQARLQDALVQ